MRPTFTLIHGTWAPFAPWTGSKSSLSRGLRARFGEHTAIDALGWGGWNNVGTRSKGGERLRAHLRGLPTADDQRHFVIAHSHGGNVCLYALREPDVAARVAGVITMATPFLVAGKRRWTERLDWALMTLLMPVIFYIVFLAGKAADRFGGGATTWFCFAALTGTMLWLLMRLTRRWDRFSDGIVESMRFGLPPRDRLLILRSPGDEASVILLASRTALAIGMVVLSVFTRLCARFEALLVQSRQRPRFGWAVGLGTAAAWLALLWLAALSLEHQWFVAGALWSVVMTLAIWVVVPLGLNALEEEPNLVLFTWNWMLACVLLSATVLPSLLLVFYGWQLAVANIAVDVSAEGSPVGDWRVVTLAGTHAVGDRSAAALTHSALYDDPRAIELICDWVQNVLDAESHGRVTTMEAASLLRVESARVEALHVRP